VERASTWPPLGRRADLPALSGRGLPSGSA